MPLEMQVGVIPDPDGHSPALLLKGDWLIVAITDGTFVGMGEATHSGDDAACVHTARKLFHQHIQLMDLSPEGIKHLEGELQAPAGDLVSATAISALNQALYDLVARRQRVPVWRLLVDCPAQESLPLYATINRALTTRTVDDYLRTISRALAKGYLQLKCAPFERVQQESSQIQEAAEGLTRLQRLRSTFPHLDLRVDFHARFTLKSFLELLPILEPLDLHWIEEPCPLDGGYEQIKRSTGIPLAVGELYFGTSQFDRIASHHWADVVMPDVKHVGGFGPLLDVCAIVAERGLAVSPHNPSGPISTLASVHAAAVTSTITSLEIPLRSADGATILSPFIAGDRIHVPDTPGWGIDSKELGLPF